MADSRSISVRAEVDSAAAPEGDARRLAYAFFLVFGPLLFVYLLIPNPGQHPRGHHADALTNVVTAWYLGVERTVILDGFEDATAPEYYRNIGWFIDSPRGPVSQYPPGAAAFGAPFYFIVSERPTPRPIVGSNNPDAAPVVLPMPSVVPGQVASSFAVAGAMGFLAAAVVTAGGSVRLGVGAGIVGGLATPMWTVAASALWQHGPGAFWVGLGVFLASRRLHFWSGLAFGAALITRPHLAAIAAAIGVYVAWKERRLGPVLAMGAGSGLGLSGLLAFNWWLWGRLTISGGYSPDFAQNLTAPEASSFLRNLFGALTDPRVGLLVISAFLVPLLLKTRPAWRDLPPWARGAALGGALYLLIQYKANRFSGGAGFAGYRYPLEPLVASVPLLAFAYPHWVRRGKFAHWTFWILVLIGALRLVTWWIAF